MICAICRKPFAGHGVAVPGRVVMVICTPCYNRQHPGGSPMPVGSQHGSQFETVGQFVPPRPRGGAPDSNADPGLGFGPNEEHELEAMCLPRMLHHVSSHKPLLTPIAVDPHRTIKKKVAKKNLFAHRNGAR